LQVTALDCTGLYRRSVFLSTSWIITIIQEVSDVTRITSIPSDHERDLSLKEWPGGYVPMFNLKKSRVVKPPVIPP